MKTQVRVLTLLCAGIMSLSAFGQTSTPPEEIVLKLKVYLESAHSFSDMADNLTVRVDELIDRTIHENQNRAGRFTLNLSIDKHYVIYFSQEGFETKSLVFSTVGADKELKYVFRADIMLERSNIDHSTDQNAMASVWFDYVNKNAFVINENYSRINYSVKK